MCFRGNASWLVLLLLVNFIYSSMAQETLAITSEEQSRQPDVQQDRGRPGSISKPDARAGNDKAKPVDMAGLHNPSIWHDPGQISSLNLFYGQGGRHALPAGPFIFEAEDMNGTNPKFDVRDAQGRKWRVKLGDEARPEVVASRLLWATGYFVDDDYLVPEADIQNLHLQRGASLSKNGHITDARFARKPKGQKKIGIWKWKQNPFVGTREFNGLRVMMALMNNWDLKDINNAVYSDKETHRELFLASDIGATFGTNGLSWTKSRSKGNVSSFESSRFITRTTDDTVDFATPRPPTAFLIETAGVDVKDYVTRTGMEWIGSDIPRADARWIGSLLSQLSHQQLVDAFRSGQFPADEIQSFVEIIETRIRQLAAL
jgi:hypothetical protein